MKKLMVIIGCAAVAALGAVAGTTNQVAVADVAKSGEAALARAEREAQRRQLNDIQDKLNNVREMRAAACAEGNTTVDELLDIYSDQTGKTLLRDPSVRNAPIKFKVSEKQKLAKEEYIAALEAVLEMNGVHLEPDGDKIVHVFPGRDAKNKGVPLIETPQRLEERGRIVSMMIPFKNIGVDEGMKALEGLKSCSGMFCVYERTNAILVTDVDKNINRMLAIAKTLDVATPVTESCFVRQIKHGRAQDIMKGLLVVSENSEANAKSARGMIRGKVIIHADERTNKLIILTSKPNMDFFDKVIAELDVEVETP